MKKSLLYSIGGSVVMLFAIGYVALVGNPFCTASTCTQSVTTSANPSEAPILHTAQSSLISLQERQKTFEQNVPAQVEWLPLEEAIKRAKRAPKKILIDLYTDWCGWCKVMDRDTYSQEEVIKYLHQNYYPVKFNAEQREDVQFLGRTFKYMATSPQQGYHQLAQALTDGNLSYPTTVLLDEKQQPITYVPGFLNAKDLALLMKFVAENKYKTISYSEYKKKNR